MHRNHKHAHVRMDGTNFLDQLKPRLSVQREVDQYQIGIQLIDQLNGFSSGLRFSADRQIVLALDQLG